MLNILDYRKSQIFFSNCFLQFEFYIFLLSMKKIKQFLKHIIQEDVISQLMHTPGSNQKYSEALSFYRKLSDEQQKQTIDKILTKIRKKQNNQHAFSCLLLLHSLIANGQMILIVGENPQISTLFNKEKIKIAQDKLIQSYFEFLRKLSIRNHGINIKICGVEEGLKQSKLILQSIMQFLKVDFIWSYCLQHSKLHDTLVLIISKQLTKISTDLIFTNQFINKWSYKIIQKTPISPQINDIYQKLIFVNKELKKLQRFKNLLQLPINFPRYELNKQLNSTIERQMIHKHLKGKITKEKEQIKKNSFMSGDIMLTDEPTFSNQDEVLMKQDTFI